MELMGKVAVITGGASGLGRATVERMVTQGANVVIFDLDEAQGSQVVETMNGQCVFKKVDVADEESVKGGIQHALDRFGKLHICVNCAGVGAVSKTVGKEGAHDLKVFANVININLIGTFNVLRLCAEQMVKNEAVNEDGEKGVIINTASVAAFDGQVGQVAYSASKGGVVGMTLPIARDLAPLGVRINVIAPGIFDTPLMNASPDKVKLPLIESTQFPKRFGRPAEYAKLVCDMVENGYLNGEIVRLDGGIRMAPR